MYDHVMSTRIFTSILHKMFIGALKIMRKSAKTLNSNDYLSHDNYMSHILGESILVEKVTLNTLDDV